MAEESKQLLEYFKQYGRVVAEAWRNKDFERRLRQDPKGTLQGMGITLSPKLEIKMIENASFSGFAVPRRDSKGQLTADIEGLADADDVIQGNVKGGVVYWALPPRPSGEISDESLSLVVGGKPTTCGGPKKSCIWPACCYGDK